MSGRSVGEVCVPVSMCGWVFACMCVFVMYDRGWVDMS